MMKVTDHTGCIISIARPIVPFFLVLFLFLSILSGVQAKGEEIVYLVEVSDVVERGLLAYMERAFNEAEEAGAVHIILNIHTPGGAVDAAEEIGNLIEYSPLPVTAFINTNATSAGAFIALSADQIIMAPTGTIGSAQVVDLEGRAADEKAQSHWKSRMAAAAEANGRDPVYAQAMVDPSIEIEGLVAEGELLNFRAEEALQHGYAEAMAQDIEEVLSYLDLEEAHLVQVEITWAEKLARFITHPLISSILLSIGSLGLILELYTPGFGLPGILGIAGLLLFFFGHLVAGFAGLEAVLLFVAGLVLLVIELFMPGFGLFGILGLIGIGLSLALASENWLIGLQNLGVALLITILVMAILSRYLQRKGVWNRLVLEEDLSQDESQARYQERSSLLGKRGIAITPLRPAGAVQIEGQRYDVVGEGGLIPPGTEVEVIKVDGPSIVVREVNDGKEASP